MAPRNVDNDTARNVVADSLGLSADDLGMDRENVFEGMNFGDDPGDDDDGDDFSQNQNQDDDGVVGNEPDDHLPVRTQQQPRDRQQQPNQQRQNQNQNRADDLSVSHTQRQGEFDVQGKLRYDNKGNILSPDGKRVIAKAGKEARMFTTLHNRTSELNTLKRTAQAETGRLTQNLNKAVEIGTDLAKRLQAAQQASNVHQQFGISESELREAAELASMFKRDGVGAIKTMLTRAAARGIDLTTLGLQPGGFDPSALMQLVRQEIQNGVAPVKQFSEQTSRQQQQQQNNNAEVENARAELNQFLIDNPEAEPYLPVINKVYENPQFQHMSLNEVWLRVQLNLARQPQTRGNSHPSQRLRNRQQPRLPNGRGTPAPGGNGEGRRAPQGEIAPVTDSYEDIVRSVMTISG